MDVYEFAMQLEKESQDFYKRSAGSATITGLKTIFNILASEEAKHYKIVKEMQSGTPQKFPDTNILSDVKAVFEQMSKSDNQFDAGIDQLEVYKKAQDIETKSRDFYLEKADEVGNPAQEAIFRKLAEEEKKHNFLLQNIMDFLSRPQTWLENAEWNHLEEY
jgi:rubrerythrin